MKKSPQRSKMKRKKNLVTKKILKQRMKTSSGTIIQR